MEKKYGFKLDNIKIPKPYIPKRCKYCGTVFNESEYGKLYCDLWCKGEALRGVNSKKK